MQRDYTVDVLHVSAAVCMLLMSCILYCRAGFLFQAEDGIRDLVRSRGLGDVYKRQLHRPCPRTFVGDYGKALTVRGAALTEKRRPLYFLSLIHI